MHELKFLDLHGDRVAYLDEGSGDEVILLIHGMAGSSNTWRSVIGPLSRKYRVVAPDLLGHGASAKPRGDYSLGAFAVWLRDLLDEIGVARATAVGQSLGGGVAMQFSYQHPDYCQRLVLISSGGLGISARAMATRCNWPPESSCGNLPSTSARLSPTFCSAPSIAASRARARRSGILPATWRRGPRTSASAGS